MHRRGYAKGADRVGTAGRRADQGRAGAWLLASPFALGFAESAAAWNAWVVGALILTLADSLSLAFDFSSWLHAQKLCYQARRISPEKLLRYG